MLEKNQAIGYMIMAAKYLEIDKETIQKLVINMESDMETWTEEYADSEYDNWEV